MVVGEVSMSGPSPNSRRRRAGALVAILAGAGVAMHGGARRLDHPDVQPLWHRLFDIGSAVLIVAAIFLLVFMVARRRRS